MTSTPREIGTLIVVVLKANHLPNKRHIGKQDPYCAITLNGQTRRTKAIKKGGQHPEWDEEIRFQVYEDDENLPQPDQHGTPPPLPPKSNKITAIKGGMFMKVACYADDAREPDLIGDGLVDLTEVHNQRRIRRFAGKVYLEMTLYSNEPEPPKKKKASTLPASAEYIGPGVFVEEGGQSNRIVSGSVIQDHSRRQSDSYSLRPSSSLAQLDLYQAPYENQAMDSLANNFGEFGITNGRRRETLPPDGLSSSHRSAAIGQPLRQDFQQSLPNHRTIPNHPCTILLGAYIGLTTFLLSYPTQGDQPSSYRPPPPVRKGRYSIPASSSGFMPLSTSASTLTSSASSVFNMPHVTGGYGPPLSHTPAPYNPPSVMYDAGGYSAPSHTPLPSTGASSIQGDYHPAPSQTPFPTSYSNLSHSLSFENGSSLHPHSESYPYSHHGSASAPPPQLAPSQPESHPVPSQTPFPTSYSNLSHSQSFENGSSLHPHPESYPYPHHGSVSAPPPQLAPSQHPSSVPISSQSTPPEGYPGYNTGSSSRDNLSSSTGPGGSRPLPPQPQGFVQAPPLTVEPTAVLWRVQQLVYGVFRTARR
ncbi:C2-domain-containing protein [Gymnopus androsaceus JB14]|uniref:C2-domain-containing protein n=1 Tax=Gymnopus androsaceus JB14 TaxID=1447944 RepID=A0A6A4IHZ0_9AGAR|nr:C2-domain-containing protein [Gymnopus androsaceus JB14]